MKIILVGGGTGGSVSPLIAIYQELKKQEENFNVLWLGTKNGLERTMIEKLDIKFKSIPAGKLRRYLSLLNFIDLFKISLAFFQSFFICLKFKPNVIISAGSFVAVPVIWAGWFLKTSVLIHQQDVKPSLANKLVAPFASAITVTFEESLKHFPKSKTHWLGNPVKEEIKKVDQGIQVTIKSELNLKSDLPIVLIIGGGTGALAINRVVSEALPSLLQFCQIIHISGKNKILDVNCQMSNIDRYHQFEFRSDIAKIFQICNLVISRAGLGILTELSYLAKPTIIIPLPNTHQEENAQYFFERHAVKVLNQRELTADKLINKVKEIINDKKKQKILGGNISRIIKRGAEKKMAKLIKEVILEKSKIKDKK